MKYRINVVILLFISTMMYSQHNMTKKEVKKITKLGKQAIIELALNQLDAKVDTSYFKSIKVMASDNDVYVSFYNPIKFIPVNSVYFYDAVVYLNGSTYSNPYNNPENMVYNLKEVHFLKYDDDVLEKIKFVIKSISEKKVLETIDWNYYENSNGMIIYDRGDHYYVNKSYGIYSEGAYSIDKNTGIVTEEYIASLEPIHGDDAVKYVEIKN